MAKVVINIEEQKITRTVKTKIVIAGEIVEVYEYSKGYKTGFTIDKDKHDVGRKKDFVSEEYDENRGKVLHRAKKRLMGLINANNDAYGREFSTKFLTLTFRENITDIKWANREFSKFIQRLNYRVFNTKKSNLKYSAVIEFQQRGAIHYHVVIYNMPYLDADVISEVWTYGFVKINKIDHVDNLGAYVTKYMTKDNDDPRLQGEKCYFNSRGLMKPTTITDKKEVETIAGSLPLSNLCYTAEYENEFVGDVKYTQYNINRINENLSILKNMNHYDK